MADPLHLRRPRRARCRCRRDASGRRGARRCRSTSRGRRTRRAAPGPSASGRTLPAPQVARDRMPDRGVVVAQLGVAERARGLQVEDVDVVAVDGEPEVPQPVIGQAERHGRGILPSCAEPGSPAGGWRCSSLANAVVVVSLWWRSGGARGRPRHRERCSPRLGRIAGLLGAYLVLVELLLLARIPALERLAGFERLTRLAPPSTATPRSRCCSRHAALITAGYTLGDGCRCPTSSGG